MMTGVANIKIAPRESLFCTNLDQLRVIQMIWPLFHSFEPLFGRNFTKFTFQIVVMSRPEYSQTFFRQFLTFLLAIFDASLAFFTFSFDYF